jgi:hypothetical protein
MMTVTAALSEQRNPYKGSPPRPWVRLRFSAPGGGYHEIELLADTGNPCSIIVSQKLMAKLTYRAAPDVNSNFGLLAGGWLHINMPDLGLDVDLVGYASDHVVATTKNSSNDFEGLAGLPLLRLLEYGGDANCFWLRATPGSP